MASVAAAGGRDLRVIGVISIGHFSSHFSHLVLPPLFPLLHAEFDVSWTALGLMLALYGLVSGAVQIPLGFWVDRFGARAVLLGGFGLQALAIAACGLAPSYWPLLALMVVAGIGNAVFHPADYAILSARIPDKRVGRAFGTHLFASYVGWMIGPKDVVKAATNLQSHATSNVSNVAQRAAIAALEGDLSAVDEMKVAFDRRRRTIVAMLNEIEGVECPTPGGAFYAYPSVKGLLGREYDGRTITTSAELSEYILDRAEVAVVPGEAFGSPGYLRLSYALGDDDIVEGITRLQKLFA